MNSDKILKYSEKNDKIIQNDDKLFHRLDINPVLMNKLKILNKEIKDKNFNLHYINLDEKLTTFPKRIPKKYEDSKTNETPKANEFNKYNFSNLNNIRRIYLRNNNLFSTEIDYKYLNKSYTNNFREKNENKNISNSNKMCKDLEPILEVYNSSKKNNYKNIYNNYINLVKGKDKIKKRHISPEQILKIKSDYGGNSKLNKYINYYPYIEKIKKIRSSKSNDNILLNRIINNFSNSQTHFPIIYRNKNLNISNSSLNKQIITEYKPEQKLNKVYNKIKERQYRTTHHRPKNNIKELSTKENQENNSKQRKLSFRKYFGDNYKYFERNESPLKDFNNTTFHNRRSPAHVFGYENYFILENSNNRLIISPWPIISKKKRLNSDENIRKYF